MNNRTQADITLALEKLVQDARLIAYRDEAGVVRFATQNFAATHNLTHRALHIDEVRRELAAHEAEEMGEWN